MLKIYLKVQNVMCCSVTSYLVEQNVSKTCYFRFFILSPFSFLYSAEPKGDSPVTDVIVEVGVVTLVM